MKRQPRMCLSAAGRARQAQVWLVMPARMAPTPRKPSGNICKPNSRWKPNLKAVTEKIKSLNKPIVTKEDIKKLEAVEIAEAQKRGVEEFKFDSNDEMLQAMGLTVTA